MVMTKKGFTLMEILFVVSVIALILTFAVPAFRSIRHDVQNSRAQNALKKLAEARRSFYQFNRGVDIASSGGAGVSYFDASQARSYADPNTVTCSNLGATGVPGSSVGAVNISQLFACNFLDWHDFTDVPYTFYVCPYTQAGTSFPCDTTKRYAAAVPKEDAGSDYTNTYLWIGTDLDVHSETVTN